MREDNLMMGCTGRLNDEGVLAKTSKAGVGQGAVQAADAGSARRLHGWIAGILAGSFLLLMALLGAPAVASARVNIGIAVSFGPPAMPYYAQPPCPAPGYIWTPGYYAWDPGSGYYWVAGAWMPAPFIGALWTPGYWDYDDDAYRWHPGYWGRSVGYYGGIDYGYGYTGRGYHGGYWDHDRFFYNRDVNRIEGRNFSHVYNRRVDDHFRDRRESYRGGPGRTFDRAGSRQGGFQRFGNGRAQTHYRGPEQRMGGRYAAPNRGGFQRAPAYAARGYSAPRGRVERAPQYRGQPANRRDFRGNRYQARPQQMRQPAHYAAQRHGVPQHQAERGGNHGGDHGHGRGGRR